MSHYDYEASKAIDRMVPPFYAIIMAAMRAADSHNAQLLADAFPETRIELDARYNAPGGFIQGDPEYVAHHVPRRGPCVHCDDIRLCDECWS